MRLTVSLPTPTRAPIIDELGDNAPASPFGSSRQFAPLVLDALLIGANAKVQADRLLPLAHLVHHVPKGAPFWT
jgi:hypothetical protein